MLLDDLLKVSDLGLGLLLVRHEIFLRGLDAALIELDLLIRGIHRFTELDVDQWRILCLEALCALCHILEAHPLPGRASPRPDLLN